MKRSITNLTFGLLLIASTLTVVAQRPPTKTISLDGKINDLIINDVTGVAVLQTGGNIPGGTVTGGKIHGYSQDEKKIVWSKDAPSVDVGGAAKELLFTGEFKLASEDFTQISGTPLVQKFFGSHLYIYNSVNGEVIFSTSGAEIYYQAEYIFDENALLLRGIENENLIVAKYSIGKKETVWKTVVIDQFKSFLKLNIIGKPQTPDRIEFTDDKVFALIKTRFFVLDKASGQLLWKNEEADLVDFQASLDGSRLILIKRKGLLGGKSEVDFYNVTAGNKIWNSSIVTKRVILFEDWQDRMLLAHYKGFNFFDYQTGEKLWKKDPKGKNIKSVIPVNEHFLYVYDDEVMLLNKNGEKLWRKDVKISDKPDEEVLYLDKTNNKRVLYVTQSLANMIDYVTGKRIWSKNIKLNEKRDTFIKYDPISGDFVLFNDEKLYRFSEDASERPEELVKLQLKNEKLVTSMEIFEDAVTISGQIEVVSVDNNGSVVFHNKYTQPGELGRGLKKVGGSLLMAGAAGATAEVTVTTTYRDPDGNVVGSTSETSALFGEKTQKLGEAGFLAGSAAVRSVKERFNAMQEDKDFAFIFAKGDAGERLLVKVDKRTGEEIDKLVMDNTKPVYDIDRATQSIFYTKGSDLMIYEDVK